MEVWCKDRAKSRRDLEEYLGECANSGTGCTDRTDPYGPRHPESSPVNHLSTFEVGAKIGHW